MMGETMDELNSLFHKSITKDKTKSTVGTRAEVRLTDSLTHCLTHLRLDDSLTH